MHTRFEHSLGVMHIAGQLFDKVKLRSLEILKSELAYDDQGFARDRQIVRLAALLHDTGHAPFSHAGEDVFPTNPKNAKRYKHEEYSSAVIRYELKDVIESHALNQNLEIKANDVASLVDGTSGVGRRALWRELIDSHMDADRMDYLLRDSLHTGVDYGKYDWRRILNTIQVIELPQEEGSAGRQGLRLGVSKGGIHAAEALVLARYYMFTQVYFHKTRVAYDHHIRHALKAMLPNGAFPLPTPDGIKEYILWDDWRVLGLLANGKGEYHGDRLLKRDHYREVYETPECPNEEHRARLVEVHTKLGDLCVAMESSKTSAYNIDDKPDISVVTEDTLKLVRPLSHYSSVVKNLNAHKIEIVRLYSRSEDAEKARDRVAELNTEPQS